MILKSGTDAQVRDYVRRRRWVRTRTPDDIPPSQQQQEQPAAGTAVGNGHLAPLARAASSEATNHSSQGDALPLLLMCTTKHKALWYAGNKAR